MTTTDLTALRESCSALNARLNGQPHWPELRAIYLDLSLLVGQIQGAVGERGRGAGGPLDVRGAQEALGALKSSVRQVGLDIRLASEPALRLGLETALEHAGVTLDCLAGTTSRRDES